MAILLFEHNLRAFNAIKTAWETSNKTCVIHATGTGKSLIISKNIEENQTAKHLFLSPSTFIFDEIVKHLDQTINYNINYQSYAYFLDKNILDDEFLNLDFIYLDEFHRIGALKWGNCVDIILEKNPNAKVLGTSATHIRYLDDNRNMAEELFNNNIASELSLGEAILKGIHKKPKYVTSLYNQKEIFSKKIRTIKKSNLSNKRKKEELERLKSIQIDWENTNGVDTILKKHLTKERKKILVFCKDNEHKKIAFIFLKPILDAIFNSKINYYFVGSTEKTSSNLKAVNSFRKNALENSVLFSVNMLNEGLHMQGTDTAIFLRSTESPIVYLQQLGRCFHVGQETQPLIIDLINNYKLSYNQKGVSKLFFTTGLNENLKEVDPLLILDFIDEIKDFNDIINSFIYDPWENNYKVFETYFKENKELPKRDSGKLGSWVGNQKHLFNNNKLSQERIDLLLAITPDFFNNMNDLLWESSYEELKDYFKVNKELPKQKKSGSLGQWVTNQKQLFNKKNLSQGKIDLLLAITPDFFENSIEVFWKNSYEGLKDYFKENIELPKQNSGKIGSWVATQKKSFNKKNLSQGKIDLLLAITPDFFEIIKFDWESNYEELKNYFKVNKELPNENSGKIYGWFRNQKKSFNKKNLSQERIDLLLAITPYFFEMRKFDWESNYEELKEYLKVNKELPKRNSGKLGTWIGNQKHFFIKNKLTQERIDLLLAITPNFFEMRKFDWESNYEELKVYFKVNKEFPKQKSGSLGHWVSNQKMDFNKDKLSKERIDLLLAINPDFFDRPHDILWKNNYEELKVYFKENIKLPTQKIGTLGNWVVAQKNIYNKKKLTQERIDLLLAITPNFFDKKK